MRMFLGRTNWITFNHDPQAFTVLMIVIMLHDATKNVSYRSFQLSPTRITCLSNIYFTEARPLMPEIDEILILFAKTRKNI